MSSSERQAPSQIRQNYHADSEKVVNDQINMELYASYVYLSMSFYFDRDDVALHRISTYFRELSDEQREHAQKLMKFQNQRGGKIILNHIKRPDENDWTSPLAAMEEALALEKKVNAALLALHKVASDYANPQFHYPVRRVMQQLKNSEEETTRAPQAGCMSCNKDFVSVWSTDMVKKEKNDFIKLAFLTCAVLALISAVTSAIFLYGVKYKIGVLELSSGVTIFSTVYMLISVIRPLRELRPYNQVAAIVYLLCFNIFVGFTSSFGETPLIIHGCLVTTAMCLFILILAYINESFVLFRWTDMFCLVIVYVLVITVSAAPTKKLLPISSSLYGSASSVLFMAYVIYRIYSRVQLTELKEKKFTEVMINIAVFSSAPILIFCKCT